MGEVTVNFDWKNNQEAIKRELTKVSKDMTFELTQTIYASLMERIFNFTKDSSGKKFGKYKSLSYKRKREQAGRQISNKDLQFSGLLKNSVKVGNLDDNTFAIGIIPSKHKDKADSANISVFQEEQLKAKIFVPSDKEIQKAEAKVIEKYIKKRSNILTK